MALEPITRAEQIMSGEDLTPITREEMFLAKATGMDVHTPEPITRREMFLSKISGSSGGSVETCLVEVSTNVVNSIIYTTKDENGNEMQKWTDHDTGQQHSLEVVCGSYVFVPISAFVPACNISGGATYIEELPGMNTYRLMVFNITASAGETVTIRCYDDD